MLKRPKTKTPKNKETAAVIYIGSNSLRLKIAQSMEGQINVLEELRYPLSLGEDTFSLGIIKSGTVNKLCEVLANFVAVARGYDISSVRTIATTALREAQNKDYVVDIIKTRTGLSVSVLNDADEKSYIYNEVTKLLPDYGEEVNNCLMAYIGVGNLGVAYYENGRLPFMHNLRLGALRLSELFENVLDYGENYFEVVDEYQYSVIEDLTILMPDKKPRHFVACGADITFVASISGAEERGQFKYIPKKSFLTRFEKIKGRTNEQLMEEYGITESRAELLFPFMSMCKTLLGLTDSEGVLVPQVYLRDAVLYEELFGEDAAASRESFNENIIAGASALATRYGVDLSHAELIAGFSIKIFDRLKKQNGFSKKDALLLNAAAIMHDSGKFINIINHDDHSYSIIAGSDISGLNTEETELIALICKFNGKIPQESFPEYGRLSAKKRVLISKLSAILGIAETLDMSHTQKFRDIDVTLAENVLTITAASHKDTLLEEWAFKSKAAAFELVFGLKAVFRRKRT